VGDQCPNRHSSPTSDIEEPEEVERQMNPGGGPSTNEILELLGARPGWRLEARSTPGATPLWCFVFNGKIEFSVTADGDAVRLYVMETDQEIVFDDGDGLMAWLRANRAEAVQEPPGPRAPGKSRFSRFTDWS
jgi:hypothetical protein